MRVVRLTVTPDADETPPTKTPEELGYPTGWEKVYGSIQDETFEEPPELPLTPIGPLDLPPVEEDQSAP